MKDLYFISGIDTDCGKTIVTGLIAKYLHAKNINVISQKFVQTGCVGIAEDILTHREIMGVDILDDDVSLLTCPYVFTHPASPHLAAEMDGVKNINVDIIDNATSDLKKKYDCVLLEGAGGLLVPINRDFTTADFLQEKQYPLILVCSSKLGSINHTLMSLEICKQRALNLVALVYNHFPADDEFILKDSSRVFKEYLNTNFPKTKFINVPKIDNISNANIDFDLLF